MPPRSRAPRASGPPHTPRGSHGPSRGRGDSPQPPASLGDLHPAPRAGGPHRGRGESPQAPAPAGHGGLRGVSRGRGESPRPAFAPGPPRGGTQRGGTQRGSRSSSRGRGFSERRRSPYRQPAANIMTVGVRRRTFGLAGSTREVDVNCFPTSVGRNVVYQYDVVSPPPTFPEHAKLPVTLNMRIVKELQYTVAPDVFTPLAVYDGQKKMFSRHELPLRESDSKFDVILPENRNDGDEATRIVYTVRLTKVGEPIDTRVLDRFINGQQSHGNIVTEALQALNVVIRMDPLLTFPSDKQRRYFYTPAAAQEIGGGFVLWRGFFQSLRPALGRLLLNIDTCSGVMYKPGPLLELCQAYLGPAIPLAQQLASERAKNRLSRFLGGMRVEWAPLGGGAARTRAVKRLSDSGADRSHFTMRDERNTTVAEYFRMKREPLQYPDLPCVEVGGKGALIPLERCSVPAGQLLHTGLPEKQVQARIQFSTQPPRSDWRACAKGSRCAARASLYQNSLDLEMQVLAHGQSEYVRQFGIDVSAAVLSTQARVLEPPALRYRPAPGTESPTVEPRNGNWNMSGKHVYKPATITHWVLVIYESEAIFSRSAARQMIYQFVEGCRTAGIQVQDDEPAVTRYLTGQSDILQQLGEIDSACVQRKRGPPSLCVVVLPNDDGGTYTSVKHWGDVKRGVATQCLKSSNCLSSERKHQFWLNVALKVNVKLGGINVVVDPAGSPQPQVASLLGDVRNGTMVMGAAQKPSYSAVVSSVDAHAAKYVAVLRMQDSRQEMISDLQEMTQYLLTRYMWYRRHTEKVAPADEAPKRIIFYRDGVSDSQLQTVLDVELPRIKRSTLLS
ncbi:Piwi domain-containing protein [Mycena sp. CBHHK59/15]|nr:Piwi domain-containing protein [Mycena sp. CBHHK59/15]